MHYTRPGKTSGQCDRGLTGKLRFWSKLYLSCEKDDFALNVFNGGHESKCHSQ